MSFLYFFPGAGGVVTRKDFESRGLGYALAATGGPEGRQLGNGPGGMNGAVAVAQPLTGLPVECSYDAKRQTWRKGKSNWIEGVEITYWVGVWNDKKPTSEQLARENVYPGNAVKLRDGNDWIVPRVTAVVPDRPSTLPRILDIAEDGETIITRADPRFEAVSADAFRFWMDWSGQTEPHERMKGPEQVALAVSALQVNYRLGKLEAIALLGLWGTDEFGLVLRAMIDADEIENFFKKKADPEITAAESSASPT